MFHKQALTHYTAIK